MYQCKISVCVGSLPSLRIALKKCLWRFSFLALLSDADFLFSAVKVPSFEQQLVLLNPCLSGTMHHTIQPSQSGMQQLHVIKRYN